MPEPEKVFYSYNEIDASCRKSAELISDSFKPDIILAIGGGGLIPARILRAKLNVPIYVVSLSTYDENDNPIEEPRIVQWMDFSNFKDKKILIVDEVDDTRKTLKFLVDKLTEEEKLFSPNLGIFVIHNKLKEKEIDYRQLNIDYYHSSLDVEDKWIVYPWD
jgi:uncharacterized protein